ncbi:MAG: extracellular solute-binding protein [Thermoanaerobacteraceae bacterium]|nr:extracellular solute-binding protein [Thermoanaerobacteraceae bacterium]
MWKRPFILFFSLLLIAFLIYWPSYYSQYRESIENPQEEEQEYKGVITMMDFPYPTADDPGGFSWIREEISRFQKQNPGVVIDLVPLNYRDGYARLESAARTGVYPDIAPVGGNYWYISRGVLEPLDEYINNINDYRQGVIEQVSKDGNVYGLPWAITSDVLFVNRDILSSYGLNNTGNLNISDLEDFLGPIEKGNISKKNVKIYALGGYIDIDDYTLMPFLFKNGKIFNDDGTPAFDEIKEGFAFFADLNKRKLLTQDFGTIDKTRAWDRFIEDRKIAVMPYSLSGILKLKSKASMQYDVVSYPVQSPASKRVIAYSVFKQNDPKKMEIIMKFMNQITSKDKQERIRYFCLMPVYQGSEALYKNDELMEKVAKIVDNTEYLPQNEHLEILDEIIKTHLRQILLGYETVDEAAAEVEREYNEYTSEGT